jgi:heme exporter protein B
LKHELTIARRRVSEWFYPLGFYVLVVILFPLSVNPLPQQLILMAPGVVWVAALLAILMSSDRLFHDDFISGVLEQIQLSHQPLAVFVLAKVMAEWVLIGVPLLLLAPLLGCLLHLSFSGMSVLFLGLLLGIPALLLVGSIGAALTVGLRHSGILITLLVLPWNIPILIFGSSAVMLAESGVSVVSELAFLAAILVLALCLAPLTAASALRVGRE